MHPPALALTTTLDSDGWGSASILAALIEGAAGVRNTAALLPEHAPEAVAVTVDGLPAPFDIAHIGTSRYVELALAVVEVRW